MFGKKKNLNDKVCEALDGVKYKYQKYPEANAVAYMVNGDDLPIMMAMTSDQNSITFSGRLMFEVPPTQVNITLDALNKLNRTIKYGRFYLDKSAPKEGEEESPNSSVFFAYAIPVEDNHISSEMVGAIIGMVQKTIDDHDGELKKLVETGGWSKYTDNNMYG